MDLELNLSVLTVESELRRVQALYKKDLQGDLKSVAESGAYVESTMIDTWCALANGHLFDERRNDLVILNIPSSQSISFDFHDGLENLFSLADQWRSWMSPEVRHILVPFNLRNVHWCLLVVDLGKKTVFCWDSLVSFDGGEYVRSKQNRLFTFLKALTGEPGSKWDLDVVFDNIPQQKLSDCGIFCIEFMRAFIGGCETPLGLQESVSQATIEDARKHILGEIKGMRISPKSPADAHVGKRVRKKSKKAQETRG